MAEELMRLRCGDSVHVESAGLTPGELNPLAIAALRDRGIDIEGKETRDVFALYQSGARFTHVISVCDEASAERCPVFPGSHTRTHWSLPDPSGFTGSWEEKLAKTRQVRDEIESRVEAWCEENCLTTTPAL
jgi:arsenate reductase